MSLAKAAPRADIPISVADIVRRAPLADVLERAPSANIVALLAPLGSGKSTLLLQWARDDERPVAWISLDRYDSDPAVLIAHLVDALEQSGLSDPALGEIRAAIGAPVWAVLMPRIAAVLRTLPPTLLLVDDVHVLEGEEAVDMLTLLALRVPPGSHLVISGRSPGRFPVPRLRVGGRIVVLGASDMALTDEQAYELLRTSEGGVTPAHAAQLNQRCEGWAAGLRLALLAGDGHDPPADPPSGNGDLVGAYVRTEVLARMSPERQAFLLQTSVLTKLSPQLCDAVREAGDSAPQLRDLEHDNVFLTALDGKHNWYRYHDLFREALLAELERSAPSMPQLLRKRAATWHLRHGASDAAVRYAMDAGDPTMAAALVGEVAQSVYNQGRHTTVLDWFGWAEGAGMVGADAGLTMIGALFLALAGEAERADRWAAAFDAMEGSGPLPDGSPGITSWQALARSLWCRSGPVQAVDDARQACAEIPLRSPWRCLAQTSLGISLIMADRIREAREALEEAVDEIRTPMGPPNARSVAQAAVAGLCLDDGDLTGARRWLALADRTRAAEGLADQGAQAIIDAYAARLALADGDRIEVRRRLAHAQRLRPLLTWALPSAAALARLELAAVHLAIADPAGARTLVLEMGDILHRRPDLGTLGRRTQELRDRLRTIREGVAGASTLTSAELRLIPMLATHLSFQEIGDRLYISTNTVKTQAMSVYRKLDATSRSEAVRGAVRAGLLDPAAVTAIITAASPA